MIMMRLLACIVLCMELAACASLKVDVSILDRRYWASAPRLRDSVANEVADINEQRTSGQLAIKQQDIKTQVRNALNAAASAPLYLVDSGTVDMIYPSLADSVDREFGKAIQHYSNAFAGLLQLQNGAASNDTASLLAIQNEIDAGNGTLTTLATTLTLDLRQKIAVNANGTPKPGGEQLVAQTGRNITSKVDSIIGDKGILDDPLASSVVYAPESFWKRTEDPQGINNTYAKGFFGNSDIAVKMESVGSFTLKGVRLDASKITQATFATGRQTIKAIAAVYGIPLPASGTASPPIAASNVVPEVDIGFASPEEQRDNAQLAINRTKVAELNVISTILNQRKALNSATDTERNAAVSIVKSVFSANRSEIAPSSNNTQQ